MTEGTIDPAPKVEVDMLVRRPAAEVYEAFADPAQITKFWLARSSGRLEPAAHVSWAFKVAGAKTEVDVLEARPGELLDLRWDEGQPLRITFADRGDTTLVGIEVTDFPGDTPNANAIESMSGFTLVLASLKMWLEHSIAGDLMYDKFPDEEYVAGAPRSNHPSRATEPVHLERAKGGPRGPRRRSPATGDDRAAPPSQGEANDHQRDRDGHTDRLEVRQPSGCRAGGRRLAGPGRSTADHDPRCGKRDLEAGSANCRTDRPAAGGSWGSHSRRRGTYSRGNRGALPASEPDSLRLLLISRWDLPLRPRRPQARHVDNRRLPTTSA